jgi:hypothetical protein
MPKLNGREPRVLKGDNNPRHFIMIRVGSGNKFCCNCVHLIKSIPRSCGVFKDTDGDGPLELNNDPHRGAERCSQCRDAEHLIHENKEIARKEGREETFYRDNCRYDTSSRAVNSGV